MSKNADAALDELAFQVSLRLMGPDARRRLRISILRATEWTIEHGVDVERLEVIDALAAGFRKPDTLQDFLDLKAAERARYEPRFDVGFWAQQVARLVRAGFEEARAAQLVGEVQRSVAEAQMTEEMPQCSEA